MKNQIETLSETHQIYVELAVVSCQSRKEISETVNRSEETVNTQFKNIYKILKINGIAELSKMYYSEVFGIKQQLALKAKEISNKTVSRLKPISICILAINISFSHASDHESLFRIRRNRRREESEFAALNDMTEIEKISYTEINIF